MSSHTSCQATTFATTHLRDGQPLAATLGLSGGALQLDDAAAVEQVIGAAFGACDTNADNHVNSSEARATQHMYMHMHVHMGSQLRTGLARSCPCGCPPLRRT